MAIILSIVSAVTGVAALIVSIYFARRQGQLAHQQTDTQQRLAAIEQARREEEVDARSKAEVIAAFETRPTSTGSSRYLVLTNRGPAQAQSVDFRVLSIDDGEPVMVSTQGHKLPIPILDAGQEYAFLSESVLSTSPMALLKLTWLDDSGKRYKELTLPVF